MCLQLIYSIYVYKKDLALNKHQGVEYTIKPN